MFDGIAKTLGNVRRVPNLKRNMISLSILDSKRHKYTSEGGVLKINKGSLIMVQR